MSLSSGWRWFLFLASIPVVLFLILLMWLAGWFYHPPELAAIEDSFEPYVVESGTLVESDYVKDVLGLEDPYAVFLYEPREGYTMGELSEEFREAVIADGWIPPLSPSALERDDGSCLGCDWSMEDRALDPDLRFVYSFRVHFDNSEMRVYLEYEDECPLIWSDRVLAACQKIVFPVEAELLFPGAELIEPAAEVPRQRHIMRSEQAMLDREEAVPRETVRVWFANKLEDSGWHVPADLEGYDCLNDGIGYLDDVESGLRFCLELKFLVENEDGSLSPAGPVREPDRFRVIVETFYLPGR